MLGLRTRRITEATEQTAFGPVIAQISQRRFEKLSKHRKPAAQRRYWATLDRKRLGLIELEEKPRWRVIVFDFDDQYGLYPRAFMPISGGLNWMPLRD